MVQLTQKLCEKIQRCAIIITGVETLVKELSRVNFWGLVFSKSIKKSIFKVLKDPVYKLER